jgi:hypothetical protein
VRNAVDSHSAPSPQAAPMVSPATNWPGSAYFPRGSTNSV